MITSKHIDRNVKIIVFAALAVSLVVMMYFLNTYGNPQTSGAVRDYDVAAAMSQKAVVFREESAEGQLLISLGVLAAVSVIINNIQKIIVSLGMLLTVSIIMLLYHRR